MRALERRDQLYDVAGVGRSLYVVGYPGLVLRSNDGGKTFVRMRLGETQEALFSVDFNARGQGAIVGRDGTAFTTDDRGSTWRAASVRLGNETPSLFSVAVLPGGALVAVGEFGVIARSDDLGKTWLQSSYSTEESGADGDRTLLPACTAASDAQLDDLAELQEARLTDVAFANDSWGLIVGEFGLVLRSEDGGRTFRRQRSCTDKTLYGVHAVDALRALAVGADGLAVETSDGGSTWTPRRTGTREHLYAVFADERRAVAVGAAGLALVRTGGGTFRAVSTRGHGWFASVYLSATGHGALVGSLGNLWTTEDGGSTYRRVFGE